MTSTKRNYNQILLPEIPVMQSYLPEEGEGMRVTGKLLPFILEEFISRGAVKILIADSWRYRDTLSTLPTAFTRHIKTLEDGDKFEKIALKLYEPLYEEFDIEGGMDLWRFKKPLSEEARMTADLGLTTMVKLPFFLMAIKHKLQIHFPITDFIHSLQFVKSKSHSPEMRANLSILLGIFTSYTTIEHDTIEMQSSAPEALVNNFIEFTSDKYYQALSEELHYLGFFRKTLEVIPKINRIVKRLFENKTYKSLIDYGSRTITVASGVPLPDSTLAESLLKDEYLPPILDLRLPINKAFLNLVQSDPGSEFFTLKSDL